LRVGQHYYEIANLDFPNYCRTCGHHLNHEIHAKMMSFEEVMQITGNTHGSATLMDKEAKVLYDACLTIPTGGMAIEVGCQLGRSSSIISQLSYQIGYDCIHIDPYTRQPEWMKLWMEMMYHLGPQDHQRFALLCMRTAQAENILKNFAPIDLAYIDGDHEYAGVVTDLKLVADKVKRGGMLVVHDYHPTDDPQYSFAGVVRAMTGYLSTGEWDPVDQQLEMGSWRRL
jgi:predicted O-methyltransferase YrrM